ncbi:uncharacterized protein LOC132737229 [Ruditapes philippinarum]|uniref:uncharacterized protein LOC132737229 n=1 Tax=Ruditapes philippinarum TaxID=129788 RepID=UPI00295B80AE|nr:uncharacterized protein LOC132737229 [Ruditapes philippinarum]
MLLCSSSFSNIFHLCAVDPEQKRQVMRVILIVTVMLAVCCMSTNAWWSRRRGSTARSEVRTNVRINNNGAPSGSGTWTRTGDNWETSVTGNVDANGNWGVGASATWRFKRSDDVNDQQLYNVSLKVDPCNFITYDVDKNDEIILGEMHAIFGDNEMALSLFLDLDENESGAIELEEFYQQAPKFIAACVNLGTDDDE